MSDLRYTLLQEIKPLRYDLSCPIEIETGALLYDNKASKVLLQIRLNILGVDYHHFSSVSLRIDCFDEVGDRVAGFNPYHQSFTSLNTFGVFSFENEIPILLDAKVRRVETAIEKVVYIDGTEWFPSSESIVPPAQKKINTLSLELYDQVNRDISFFLPDENRDRIIYIPMQLNNYWLCSCGRPNRNSQVICGRCGLSRKWIFRNLSETGIQLNLERHRETLQDIEAESLMVKKQKAIRRKKWNFQLQRAFLVILGLGLLIALFFSIGSPYIQYAHANNLLKDAEYDKAILIYETLGDFKNSEVMINEANYQKAFTQLANKKYDEALALFKGNAGYKNSDEMIDEVKYQKANYLLANKRYDESASLFIDLKDFRNSRELVHEANYQKAKKLLEQNEFEAASTVLSFTRNYKDSDKLYNKAIFLWGMQLMGRNEWNTAKTVLEKVDKHLYPEVSALIEDAQKRIDKEEKEKKDKKDKK